MSDKVRHILRAISDDSETLRQFRENPEAVADRYDLSPADRERLQHSEVLVSLVNNPFIESAAGTMTLHTITITGTPPVILPQTLEELSHERLLSVTKQILIDPDYAARVRDFLGL